MTVRTALRFLTLAVCLLVWMPGSSFADPSPSPLVVVFQKQSDPAKMQQMADAFARELAQRIGRPARAVVPGDYAASVQAIVSRTADIAYVDSMSCILALRDGGASILLAEQRPDTTGALRTEYDSLFVVRRDSTLKSYEDLIANARTLSIAFTSRTSTSGFLFPYRRFVESGLVKSGQRTEEVFARVAYSGSYDLALREVLTGKADVAAVSHYAFEGPKADRYLKPEERSQLRILARTPGVPTHMVIARAGLEGNERESVIRGLLAISSERPELLTDVYGASSFIRVDESHIAATRAAVSALGTLSGAAK